MPRKRLFGLSRWPLSLLAIAALLAVGWTAATIVERGHLIRREAAETRITGTMAPR